MNNDQPIFVLPIEDMDKTIGYETKAILNQIIDIPNAQWSIDHKGGGTTASFSHGGKRTLISLHKTNRFDEENYAIFSIAVFPHPEIYETEATYDLHDADLRVSSRTDIVQSIKNALSRLVVIGHKELDKIAGFNDRDIANSPFSRIGLPIIQALSTTIPEEERNLDGKALSAWYRKSNHTWAFEIYQPAGAQIIFDTVVDEKLSASIPRVLALQGSPAIKDIALSSPSISKSNVSLNPMEALQAIASLHALQQLYATPPSESD